MSKAIVTTSSMFESYEEDFHRLQRGIREQLSNVTSKGTSKGNSISPASRVSAISEAGDLHNQAGQALQQMELETRSMGALGNSIAPKLKDYRSEFAATKRHIREAEQSLQREGIGLPAKGRELTTEDKKTATDSFNRLRSSTKRLEETRRTALEAEEIGMDVMTDLVSQRESIMRSKANIHDTNENLAVSKRVLSTLHHKAVINQLSVGALAVVLTIAVILVVWAKLEKLMEKLR
eukprot:TRINITY_DN48142_c0_g1_i1.p1 TRINITY_DN48142_c0_g1~~TRINITY_DN48142_c0_g1_i1.p1  ORF type:complete len:236 (-),score=35.76 TRINITY_DN48142_c0_g1_i1:259-966(-)